MFRNQINLSRFICRDANDGTPQASGGAVEIEGGTTGLDSFLGTRDNPTGTPQSAGTETNQQATTTPEVTIPDKFKDKSPEEIIQSYMELENQVGSLRSKAEQAGQLEALLTQMMESGMIANPNQGAATTQEQVDELITEEEAFEIFKNPKTALENIMKKAVERAQKQAEDNIVNKERAEKTKAELRNTFYSTYEDLKGAEIIVGSVSGIVQAQYPNVHPSKLFPVIAKICREEISKIRGTGVSTSTSTPFPTGNARPTQEVITDSNQKHINSLIDSRR